MIIALFLMWFYVIAIVGALLMMAARLAKGTIPIVAMVCFYVDIVCLLFIYCPALRHAA
jgi:hypothetical protein